MVQILIVLVAVFVIGFVISLIIGDDSEKATSNGCMSSLGCGYGIAQIIITAGILALIVMFISWIFN